MADFVSHEFTDYETLATEPVAPAQAFIFHELSHYETFSFIGPEGLAVAAVFGFPTFENSPSADLEGLEVEIRFGEPWLDLSAEPTPVVVENVEPTPPGPMSTTTAWEADIVGDIEELLVWVSYEGLQTEEMAYRDDGFSPDFSGVSSVEDLGGGSLHILLKRNGGWPDAPRVHVRARSTDGGVNES